MCARSNPQICAATSGSPCKTAGFSQVRCVKTSRWAITNMMTTIWCASVSWPVWMISSAAIPKAMI
ncbi:UNVERIFIED_CONTAM: hypothetical protein GTU68_055621 [Idotea baltica]|nr:hypothetical protein [Idotea baltica]